MIKYSTTYALNGKTYFSEIFCPSGYPLNSILDARNLPDEIIIATEILTPEQQTLEHNDKERISYYIENDKYVDAMHRFFYLATIVGSDLNLIPHIQDDGMVHKLSHIKTQFQMHDVPPIIEEADTFEKTIPGSFLWALEQSNP